MPALINFLTGYSSVYSQT